MEAVNDSSKLVAQSLELLKAIDDERDWKNIFRAIELLEEALVKLTNTI